MCVSKFWKIVLCVYFYISCACSNWESFSVSHINHTGGCTLLLISIVSLGQELGTGAAQDARYGIDLAIAGNKTDLEEQRRVDSAVAEE